MTNHQPRGGHAPEDLRVALKACIENRKPGPWYEALGDNNLLEFRSPIMQGRWDRMSLQERGLWLVGQLWNCTDTLPSAYRDEDLGFSYASASQALRKELK
jgi:hypothetical protein